MHYYCQLERDLAQWKLQLLAFGFGGKHKSSSDPFPFQCHNKSQLVFRLSFQVGENKMQTHKHFFCNDESPQKIVCESQYKENFYTQSQPSPRVRIRNHLHPTQDDPPPRKLMVSWYSPGQIFKFFNPFTFGSFASHILQLSNVSQRFFRKFQTANFTAFTRGWNDIGTRSTTWKKAREIWGSLAPYWIELLVVIP